MKFSIATYNLFQLAASPVLFPSALMLLALRRKYRSQFIERFTFRRPKIPEASFPTIWIHTLSFGEVNAAVPLIQATCRRWPDATVICSAGTLSGYRALQKRADSGVSLVTYPPYDLLPLCSAAVKAFHPDCFVLVETDVWPNLLWSLHSSGSGMLFVNAAISTNACRKIKRLPGMSGLLYGSFDLIAAQSEDDANRFRSICKKQKIVDAGDLKFDVIPEFDIEQAGRAVRLKTGCRDDDLLVVAGSTHAGEEEMLLAAFMHIRESSVKNVRMIIAPRNPERGGVVERLVAEFGFSSVTWSRLDNIPAESVSASDIIIVDTLGELARCYSAASVAFVGGSLVATGGHNLLEPAVCGVPVFFGPFVESCRDVADMLVRNGGGVMVSNGEELALKLVAMLNNRFVMHDAGNSALSMVNKNRGVVARHVDMMENVISGRSLYDE